MLEAENLAGAVAAEHEQNHHTRNTRERLLPCIERFRIGHHDRIASEEREEPEKDFLPGRQKRSAENQQQNPSALALTDPLIRQNHESDESQPDLAILTQAAERGTQFAQPDRVVQIDDQRPRRVELYWHVRHPEEGHLLRPESVLDDKVTHAHRRDDLLQFQEFSPHRNRRKTRRKHERQHHPVARPHLAHERHHDDEEQARADDHEIPLPRGQSEYRRRGQRDEDRDDDVEPRGDARPDGVVLEHVGAGGGESRGCF